MDYEDIAQSAMQGFQVHRDTVFSAVIKNLGASKFESPELVIEAPVGFVLKAADEMPVIHKGLPEEDCEMLDELIANAVAAARALADADIERLHTSFMKALRLPSIDETRKVLASGEFKPEIQHIPVWGKQ
jgi:hypothetical protein